MITIESHGSIALFRPSQDIAEEFWSWVDDNVGGEYQSWGSALVVEHGYVGSIAYGLSDVGFDVGL